MAEFYEGAGFIVVPKSSDLKDHQVAKMAAAILEAERPALERAQRKAARQLAQDTIYGFAVEMGGHWVDPASISIQPKVRG